jgi:hypothetical protein
MGSDLTPRDWGKSTLPKEVIEKINQTFRVTTDDEP